MNTPNRIRIQVVFFHESPSHFAPSSYFAFSLSPDPRVEGVKEKLGGGKMGEDLEELYKKAREKINDAILRLFRENPVLGAFVRTIRIYLTTEVPTACVNLEDEMYVNPQFVLALGDNDLAFVLCHEAMHVLYRHCKRFKDKGYKNSTLWNVITDAKINEELIDNDITTDLNIVRFFECPMLSNEMSYEEFKEMSSEEIYERLKDKVKTVEIPLFGTGDKEGERKERKGGKGGGKSKEKQEKKEGEGDLRPDFKARRKTLVNKGEKEIYRKPANRRNWKDIIDRLRRIYTSAGKEKDEEKIRVKETKTTIDWKKVLRYYVKRHFDMVTSTTTWRRINRKVPVFPGYRKEYSRRMRIHCFVDISGSTVCTELFDKFVNEIVNLGVKYKQYVSELVFVTWDTDIHGIYRFKNPRNARKLLTVVFEGGGGTVLSKPLREYLKKMKVGKNDIFIIFSDFDIYDEEEARKAIKEIPARTVIGVTTRECREYIAKYPVIPVVAYE